MIQKKRCCLWIGDEKGKDEGQFFFKIQGRRAEENDIPVRKIKYNRVFQLEFTWQINWVKIMPSWLHEKVELKKSNFFFKNGQTMSLNDI